MVVVGEVGLLEADFVSSAIGLGEFLLLDGVNPGQTADGLIQIDRAGSVLRRGSEGYELFAQVKEPAAHILF